MKVDHRSHILIWIISAQRRAAHDTEINHIAQLRFDATLLVFNISEPGRNYNLIGIFVNVSQKFS